MRIHIIRNVPRAIAAPCAAAALVMLGTAVQAEASHGVHVAAHPQILEDGNPWGRPPLMHGLV